MPNLLTKILFIYCSFLISAHAENMTLPIVADDNAPPKNWLENGQPQGFMFDLLDEVSDRTGIQFSYEFGSWNRVFTLSEAGKAAIIGFSRNEEREQLWDFSVPMYYDELVLVTTRDRQFEYTGYRSLIGKVIAVKRGARYGDDFEEAIDSGLFSLLETEDRAGQMRMMLLGRVDAVLLSPGEIALMTVIAGNDWLKPHAEDFVVLQPPVKLDPNYLGVPKSMHATDKLEQINQALTDMKADGTYDTIVNEGIHQHLETLRLNQ